MHRRASTIHIYMCVCVYDDDEFGMQKEQVSSSVSGSNACMLVLVEALITCNK